MAIKRLILVILLSLCLCVHSSAHGGDSDTLAEAQAILQAHIAHMESFQQFTCRYTGNYTKAASIEDAIADRFLDPPQIAQFLWIRDRDYKYFQVLEDPNTTEALTNPKLTPAPFGKNLMMGPVIPWSTAEHLAGPKGSIIYDERDRHGWVRSADKDWRISPIPMFPYLDIDDYTPSEVFLLDKIAKGESPVIALEYLDNELDAIVQLQVKYSTKCDMFWFDSSRNYVLVRYQSEDKESGHIFRIDFLDYRAVPNNRWFPTRKLESRLMADKKRWQINDYRVTDLQVDQKPDRDLFSIAVQAGTYIMDLDGPTSSYGFDTRKRERIHADDLGRIYEMTQRAVEEPYMDTAIVQPRRYTWAWWLGGGVGVVALLLLVRYVLRRRIA